jgi:hypothetical protein
VLAGDEVVNVIWTDRKLAYHDASCVEKFLRRYVRATPTTT